MDSNILFTCVNLINIFQFYFLDSCLNSIISSLIFWPLLAFLALFVQLSFLLDSWLLSVFFYILFPAPWVGEQRQECCIEMLTQSWCAVTAVEAGRGAVGAETQGEKHDWHMETELRMRGRPFMPSSRMKPPRLLWPLVHIISTGICLCFLCFWGRLAARC